jgi:hypothetical protein
MNALPAIKKLIAFTALHLGSRGILLPGGESTAPARNSSRDTANCVKALQKSAPWRRAA